MYGTIDCPYFGLRVPLPIGIQSQGGSVTSGATPAFSTNKGVHCISVYAAGPPSRHPLCKQRIEGNGGLLTWAAV